jgi:hypothetical protein
MQSIHEGTFQSPNKRVSASILFSSSLLTCFGIVRTVLPLFDLLLLEESDSYSVSPNSLASTADFAPLKEIGLE